MSDIGQATKAAKVIAEAQNVPFPGPKQHRIAKALADAGLLMPPPQQPGDGVTRLSVNLAPTVAKALTDYTSTHGVSLTEATRRAIALLNLANETFLGGERLMVVTGHGPDATYREVLLP